jgi:hypothetical protein
VKKQLEEAELLPYANLIEVDASSGEKLKV